MKYPFHPDAVIEFDKAIDYYEVCQARLGYEFSLEVYSAIKRITRNPGAWTILENNIRRCLVHRFPFGIIYSEQPDEILILAIMNLRRHPNYWKYRTE